MAATSKGRRLKARLRSSDREVTLVVDGEPVTAYQGETVAGALMADQRLTFRISSRHGMPRGLFCGMGVCFDCAVQIDGRPNRRACRVLVADGMEVETQDSQGGPS